MWAFGRGRENRKTAEGRTCSSFVRRGYNDGETEGTEKTPKDKKKKDKNKLKIEEGREREMSSCVLCPSVLCLTSMDLFLFQGSSSNGVSEPRLPIGRAALK